MTPTAEQLETEAQQLPAYPVAPVPAEWPERTTTFGFALRLPPEFAQVPPDPDEQAAEQDRAMWQSDPTCFLTLALHQGVGHFVAALEFDGDVPPPVEEGAFQLPMAGRTARLELTRYSFSFAGHEFFVASATAALADGSTVAAFVLATTTEARDRLIACMASVQAAV